MTTMTDAGVCKKKQTCRGKLSLVNTLIKKQKIQNKSKQSFTVKFENQHFG